MTLTQFVQSLGMDEVRDRRCKPWTDSSEDRWSIWKEGSTGLHHKKDRFQSHQDRHRASDESQVHENRIEILNVVRVSCLHIEAIKVTGHFLDNHIRSLNKQQNKTVKIRSELRIILQIRVSAARSRIR